MDQIYFNTRQSCPGCGSSRRHTLYSNPYTQPPISVYLRSLYPRLNDSEFEYLQGATFTLDQCRDCTLVFQVEIPNHVILKRLYELWIEPTQSTPHHVKGFKFTRQYLQELLLIIQLSGKPATDLKVLDFGMGWGHWCLVARAFGCQVWGYELSQPQIEHAKAQGINVVTWDEIPQHQFDFIGTEQVFEHLDTPLETLQHLRRGLAPRGILKIATPDGSAIPGLLQRPDWNAPKYSRNSLNPVSPLEHLNSFNPTAARVMARQVGLEVVNVPVGLHYGSLLWWKPIRSMLRNLTIPLYRKIRPRKSYFLFRPT